MNSFFWEFFSLYLLLSLLSLELRSSPRSIKSLILSNHQETPTISWWEVILQPLHFSLKNAGELRADELICNCRNSPGISKSNCNEDDKGGVLGILRLITVWKTSRSLSLCTDVWHFLVFISPHRQGLNHCVQIVAQPPGGGDCGEVCRQGKHRHRFAFLSIATQMKQWSWLLQGSYSVTDLRKKGWVCFKGYMTYNWLSKGLVTSCLSFGPQIYSVSCLFLCLSSTLCFKQQTLQQKIEYLFVPEAVVAF